MSTFDRISEEKNWYVLHTYSGYEKKVEQNLASRMKSMGMEENIFEVLVPEQETYEEKNGLTFKEWLPLFAIDHPDIDDIDTNYMYCWGENLIDLDGIQDFKELSVLDCHSNNLTSLNLEGMYKLRWIDCSDNELTNLNIEGCDNLQQLKCSGNNLPYNDLDGYWKWYQKEYPDRWEARKFNF